MKKKIVFPLIIVILIILLLRICSKPKEAEADVPQPVDSPQQEIVDTLSTVEESAADTVAVDNAATQVRTFAEPKRSRRYSVWDTPANPPVQSVPLEQSDAVSDAHATVVPEEDISDTTAVTPADEAVESVVADTENIVTDTNVEGKPRRNALGVLFTPDFYGDSPIVSIQWKHFFNTTNILDIRAAYQFNWGPELSALFEWNVPFKDSGLSFYAGPGIHIGLITNYSGNRDSCLNLGFAGAAGFEYNFPHSPLALSLDWHPYLTWQPSVDNKAVFGWRSFQLGAKYCF